MYSPNITKQHVLRAEEALGFPLEYHSVSQVEAANKHFDDLKRKGKFPEDESTLPLDQYRYLINERTLCQLDYNYWSTRYAWIKGITNYGFAEMRYEPNVAQHIVNSVYSEAESRGVEILAQWLKARRLGISTDSELRIQHRLQFYSNVTAIIGSSDPTSSAKMHKMVKFSWDRQPFWLLPKLIRFKEGIFYEYSNGCYVSIEHGTQFKNIGVGNDPSIFHLSECFQYDKPEELIDSGLMPAVIPSPFVFGVEESTAEGDTGWWHDSYWYNKVNYEKRASRFQANFLPWFVGCDLYPNKTYLRGNPVPSNWKPDSDTLDHAQSAKEYVRNSPLLSKHLGKDWEMPVEQMWYRHCQKREHKEKHTLHILFSQYPASDLEAFTAPLNSIFDAELIDKYRNSCAQPKAVFGIRGQSIPLKHWPTEKDIWKDENDRPYILKVTADWSHNLPPYEFEFVRLKFHGYSECHPSNKLFIWEWPEPDNQYFMPADTSDGLGEGISDNSVIQVLRKGDKRRNDAQVAEFSSPQIAGTELWPWTLAIGTFFSTLTRGRPRQPQFIPEVNREGGRSLWQEMEKRGWKEVYYKARQSSVRRGNPTIIYGWHMDELNRPEMLQWLKYALDGEYIEINSPWFVREMGHFVRDEQGKWQAAKGKKDDRIISLGIGHYVMYHDEVRNTSPTPHIERQKDMPEEKRYPVYQDIQGVVDRSLVISGYMGCFRRPTKDEIRKSREPNYLNSMIQKGQFP